jgi:uncharacterized phage protein gp47/JayE
MSSIGATGFVLENLAQRIAALQASFQAIFGPDINVDPNAIDGQFLGVFAESAANLDLLAQVIYDSFDPAQATAAALDRLVTLNGITRMIGTYSLVALVCTGTAGTLIPAGSLVTSADGSSTWTTLDDATIGSGGSVTVTGACTVIGPVTASANVLTVITSVIYGWLQVTNPAAAILGSNTETDEQLRARRNQSTATPSQGIIDGIYGAALNVPGVTAAVLYENPTETTDGNGLPPHSMNLVIEGGTAADIGEALWLKRSVGSTQIGAQSVTIFDSYGNPHVMKFDIPTAVPIYIVVNGTSLPGYPLAGADDIIAALVAWGLANLGIGDEVVQSALYIPIMSVPGVSITSVYIGTSYPATTAANIAIAFNAIAEILSGNDGSSNPYITVNIT